MPGLQCAPSREEEAEVEHSCDKDRSLEPAQELQCLGRSGQAPHGRSGAFSGLSASGFPEHRGSRAAAILSLQEMSKRASYLSSLQSQSPASSSQ